MKKDHWHKKMVLAWALSAAVSAESLPALAAGHVEGNGGDGVYVGGKLTLRDFLDSGDVGLVDDNLGFLDQTPDFRALIDELTQVQPHFALNVVDQLLNARIWTTREALPLLPEAVTTVVGRAAEVQIAVRDKTEESDDIVISLPAFNKVEGAYVLLHEALHGMIDGQGPMHHSRVRAVVRYVKENRGKLTTDKFSRLLENAGVGASMSDSSDERFRRLRALMTPETSKPEEESRCVLSSFLDATRYGWQMTDVYYPLASYQKVTSLKEWTGLNRCAKNAYETYLKKEAQALLEFRMEQGIPSAPYMTRIGKRPGWFSRSWEHESWQRECENYGSKETLARLNCAEAAILAAQDVVARARKAAEALESDFSSQKKPAELEFGKFYVRGDYWLPGESFRTAQSGPIQFDERSKYLAEQLTEMKEAKTQYEANAKVCQEE